MFTPRYLQLFLQLSYHLQRAHEAGGGLPAQLATWDAMCTGSGLVGEQLAYVAALAIDASIVYCDRPKEATYRRLHEQGVADLDYAFGQTAWSNYLVRSMVSAWFLR